MKFLLSVLTEPSTHSSIAVLIVSASMLANSLSLEFGALPWLLGWASLHAVIGVFMKEGR